MNTEFGWVLALIVALPMFAAMIIGLTCALDRNNCKERKRWTDDD